MKTNVFIRSHSDVCDCHSTQKWVIWDALRKEVVTHCGNLTQARRVVSLARQAEKFGMRLVSG